MVISLFNEEKEYTLNHIRSKPLRDGFLITTDYGSWAYLTKEEFDLLKKEKLNENIQLFNLLKDKGIVLTRDNISKIVNDYRQRMGFLFQGTSLHIIVVTLRCNQKCVYCHSAVKDLNDKKFDMNEEIAKKTVDFLFQSPSKAIAIEFQGGEPLLNFEIIKFIVKYAKEKNKKHNKNLLFRLVTNLTLMTEEILDYLIKEQIEVCSSLDGPRNVHNENRKYLENRGSYKEVSKWIDILQRRYRVNAMTVVTKQSLPYYREIIDEYKNQHLKSIFLKYVNPLGFAKKQFEKIAPSAEEFLDFWKKSMDYLLSQKDAPREVMTSILLKKILSRYDANYTDLQGPCCGTVISQLTYNYNGAIHSCDEAKIFDIFKLGTVNDKYKDIVTSSQSCALLEASMNDHPVLDKDVYKPYLSLCPVVNYAKTGNIITKLPDERIKIYTEMLDYIFEKLLFDEKSREILMKWVN